MPKKSTVRLGLRIYHSGIVAISTLVEAVELEETSFAFEVQVLDRVFQRTHIAFSILYHQVPDRLALHENAI